MSHQEQMKLLTVLLVTSFFLSSCATYQQPSDADAFRSFWNPVLDRSKNDSPASVRRIRIEDFALVFEGTLTEGDCDRVKGKLEQTKVDRLIVNSQGGLVSEGLCIAELLSAKGIKKVVVKGVCWSSCANYLFLGAEEKMIDRGTVGFHGNSIALMKKGGVLGIIQKFSTGVDLMKRDRITLRSYLSRAKSSDPLSIEERAILQKMSKTYKREKKFFESIKVPQDFFDMTQLPDKGQNDGKSYLFFMPSASYLARELRVSIHGDQDTDFIERANLKFPVGLLYKN